MLKDYTKKFTPAQRKLVSSGRILFCVMDGTSEVFSSKNPMEALFHARRLQKENPHLNYSIIASEVK